MKVALIFPPFRHRRFSENLKVIDEEFVTAPPVILGYVAAIMEGAGHEVLLLDAHALGLTKEAAAMRVSAFDPDLLAFRVDTYGIQETLDWARHLKAAAGVPVLVGGINMSLYPEETLSHDCVDFGIAGEALESLPAFLHAFETSGPYHGVPGLCWKTASGGLRKNPPAPGLADFDDYPFPARHLLPNERYGSFVSQRRNYTVMLTSTGCPYKCSFCAIAGLGHYRERSWQNVLAEIEECYHRFGVREIDFFDATFFINKDRCRKLFQGIRDQGLDITWTCRTRVDVADEEILKDAASAGCRMIFWGIESSSQAVLDSVSKGIRREQTERAVKAARAAGIRSLGFLMVGAPGDTEQSVRETMAFVKNIGLDYVQVCRTMAKPGSQLNQSLVRGTGRDYWSEFTAGKVKEARLPAPWTGLSQAKVEELLKRAYYGFYFRPAYILRTALQARSIGELFRYIKVGVRMLLHYFHTDAPVGRDLELVRKAAHWKLSPKLSEDRIPVSPAPSPAGKTGSRQLTAGKR